MERHTCELCKLKLSLFRGKGDLLVCRSMVGEKKPKHIGHHVFWLGKEILVCWVQWALMWKLRYGHDLILKFLVKDTEGDSLPGKKNAKQGVLLFFFSSWSILCLERGIMGYRVKSTVGHFVPFFQLLMGSSCKGEAIAHPSTRMVI